MAIIHIVLFEWKASTSHAQVEEVSISVGSTGAIADT